ncbi:MAG: hypothetical protein JW787_18055 [Sedimentisphaerales bacterium]|nr:hypothetical protein [Sedimentisphaerales bacterium]
MSNLCFARDIMNIGTPKIRSNWRLLGGVLLTFFFWSIIVNSLYAQPTTENEAIETLKELRLQFVPEPNVPMPEIYKSDPEMVEQTVGGKSEWKLFYFCRYHTSDELKTIIHEQFATKLFDQKGKETQMPDYNVTSNPATNQLIVRCPARQDTEAVLETLRQIDVPPVQVKVDCLISEIYADFTYDRETTIAIENLFGENVTLKPGGTAFGEDVRELIDDDEYLAAFPGASLRELIRARMGLKIGYSSTAHEFTALVDMLESRGFLKILMNPTLEIVNGKTAKVESIQHVPIDTITMRSTQSDYLETKTEYEDVIDSLEITPHVFADGYIGLETKIILGAKNTPDGVKQIPILTKKEITSKENRIRSGESLIIGGMRKTEKFGVARGVPILKDIPLIGFLFSGEDTEERAVETVFILTPVISTNGRPQEEILAEIERRHSTDKSSNNSISDTITDPFGTVARQHSQDSISSDTEKERISADVKIAESQAAVRKANEQLKLAEERLRQVTEEAEKINADLQRIRTESNTLQKKDDIADLNKKEPEVQVQKGGPTSNQTEPET